MNQTNPSVYAFYLSQDGSISLPSEQYYSDERIFTMFQAHVARAFVLEKGLAAEDAAIQASLVVQFEKQLASFRSPRDQMRDPLFTNNVISISNLTFLFPGFDWVTYFAKLPKTALASAVSVDSISYFTKLSELLLKSNSSTLMAYASYRLFAKTAFYLATPIYKEFFSFYKTELLQQKTVAPRNLTCTELTDKYLGDMVGRIFVERKFSGNSRAAANDLIGKLESAIHDRFSEITWFDSATRDAALQKLAKITSLIGFSDNWDTYSGVILNKASFFNNFKILFEYALNVKLRVFNQPVDKTIWQMTAATVNAYYDPTLNTINFPAGILQPPFFSSAFPAASNYGGIGMVIGHELMHAFDDQGSHYDGGGRLHDWWSVTTRRAFQERASCLANQYGLYQIDGVNVNGNLTLGENIADNGGLSTAWNGFNLIDSKEASWSNYSPLSEKELFFVSFAQGWCSLRTPGLALNRLRTDPHSPPQFRVNGPLSNFAPFAEVFKCPLKSKMNPIKKCLLW